MQAYEEDMRCEAEGKLISDATAVGILLDMEACFAGGHRLDGGTLVVTPWVGDIAEKDSEEGGLTKQQRRAWEIHRGHDRERV